MDAKHDDDDDTWTKAEAKYTGEWSWSSRRARAEGKDEEERKDVLTKPRNDYGFEVNWMNMRDAFTGQILWEQNEGWSDMYDKEIEAHVPRDILNCKAVSREVNFSSKSKMHRFRLDQQVLLHGQPFEEWTFSFGFVMPGSTNTWQQVIEAADEMLPVDILSGNVVIDTRFFDGDAPVANCRVRIFYDG